MWVSGILSSPALRSRRNRSFDPAPRIGAFHAARAEDLAGQRPNAPVQARWANAQRAGPAPPNPLTVACNRLLGSSSLIAGLILGRLEAAMEKGARAHASTNSRPQQETPVSLLEE